MFFICYIKLLENLLLYYITNLCKSVNIISICLCMYIFRISTYIVYPYLILQSLIF